MAAHRLHCWLCGIAFYGRVDARYCSAACRQKAHRKRNAGRVVDTTVGGPEVADAKVKARQVRQQARAVRRRAEATRRAAAETRALVKPTTNRGPRQSE
jgi:hypothetical protein